METKSIKSYFSSQLFTLLLYKIGWINVNAKNYNQF